MSRFSEILLVLLLLVFGSGVVVQYQNQKLQEQNQQLLVSIEDRLGNLELSQNSVSLHVPKPGIDGAQPANPNTAPVTPTNPVAGLPPAPTPKPTRPAPTVPVTPTPPDTTKPEPSLPTKPPVDPAPSKPTPTDDPRWESSGPLVESVIRQLLAGEYDAVLAKMDPVMQTNMPREVMAGAIDPMRKEHGEFSKFVGHKVITEHVPPGMSTFAVDTEFADGYQLRFTVTIDSKQRISGLIADSVE